MSNKVPKIRFNGYSDAWVQRKLGDIVDIKSGDAPSKFQVGHFPYLKVDDLNNSFVYQNTTVNHVLETNKTPIPEGAVVFSKRGAAIMTNKVRILATPMFMDTNMMALIAENVSSYFLFLYIQKERLARIADTSTIPQINNKHIIPYEITIPKQADESDEIGRFFEHIDNLIAANHRKLDLLKEQKKGYLQKMFPKNGAKVPELRFAGFADDWEERKFKDILKTYSFRSYLANASDHGKYEVIQQGDNPIVGYSDGIPFMNYKDVILFGDHTVSLYKPHSPFFISTDGVKILSADNFEGNYLYTTLERYKPDSQGYKRHFTILKNQELWFTRNMEEQQKVGSFFKQLDNNIALQQKKISLLKDQKKGLLQKMFI